MQERDQILFKAVLSTENKRHNVIFASCPGSSEPARVRAGHEIQKAGRDLRHAEPTLRAI
jgi:hypothetical protein